MRPPAFAVALVTIAVLSSTCCGGVAGAEPAVSYRPPVDAPVVDTFRPPPQRWAEGNRGVDYDTVAGTAVRAAAGGEVVFAGQVGGSMHVVVLHSDGIRTSYSFLASVSAHRGDRVGQGDPLGTTAGLFHFGARSGGEYIDPLLLFTPGRPRVHLVPDGQRRRGSEREERRGLLRGLGRRIAGVVGGGVDAADWARRQGQKAFVGAARAAEAGLALSARVVYARVAGHLDELRGLAHYVQALHPLATAREMGRAALEWWHDRTNCTPASRSPPPLKKRHVAVLVAGLGSTHENAAVYEVDTAALGYRSQDVWRFSYRGGTTDQNHYGATDTTVDIRRSARRLRELIQQTAAANPGVPIDVIAHSQGGLVARAALALEFDGLDPRLPPIGSVVTLGTPHRGTDGATALAMLSHTLPGRGLQWAYRRLRPDAVDPRGQSVRQMAETSTFIRDLNRHPLPTGVWLTSVAARDDLVVPARHSRVRGGQHVVVAAPGGLQEHDRLPGSPQAQREIALAVAHLPPTCQPFGTHMTRAFVAGQISILEDRVGAALWAAGRLVDVGGA